MTGRKRADAATGASGLDRLRILVVEDDPAVRRSLQLLLQGQGYDVRAFGSGEALVSKEAFAGAACLVADYQMELDGIALLAQLRGRGWHAPAILITAYPSEELAQRAAAAGYAAVFEKPLRERSLIEALGRLVQPRDDAADGNDKRR